MEELSTIQNLFKPLQPSVKSNRDEVEYLEITPSYPLNSFIYCYWQLKSKKVLSSDFQYRVVSDGCIDILWELGNTEQPFINGFSNKYTEFSLSNSFNYMGIRFLPTAFPTLFSIPASTLTNKFFTLEEIHTSLHRELKTRMATCNTIESLKDALDEYFKQKISSIEFDFDMRLYNAIDLILKSQGTLSISNDIDTGISPRQLRRLFNFYIGDSPKTFSKIVRFQNILLAKPSKQSLKNNKLFYDLGYFDQAHFIKEFKHMYGLTPTIALH